MNERSEMNADELLNILSQSTIATAVYAGKEMIIRTANDSMIRIWGKDSSVIGQPLEKALPELEGQPFLSILQDVWKTGITYRATDMPANLVVDGKLQTYYFDFSYQAIKYPDRSMQCILNTASDVTDRFLGRQRLRESESRYYTLFNSIEDGYCIIEQTETDGKPDFRYLEANPAFEKQTSVTNITGKTIREAFPGEEDGIAMYNEIVRTGEVFRGERYVSYTNRWMEYSAFRVGDKNSRQVAVIFKDISKRKQALARLEESEERFRNMAEKADILIALSDETMNTIYLNQAWAKLTGRSVEELLQIGWADLVHPDDKDLFLLQYREAFTKKVYFKGEFRMKSYNGDYRWLYAKCSPRFQPDGSFAGYIASAIDITERKEDEQRKNDFIGMVSHELKTPLTSLNAYLQVLHDELEEDKKSMYSSLLEKANKQVTKMTTLINGFLNVTRLESGKIHIAKQVFDMAELIHEIEQETRSMYKSHRFIFHPVETTFVSADRDKIGQVINNLISNAVKYSPNGTTIQIACVTENQSAVVRVSDTGIGINRDDQDKLFDRYYRVNNDITTAASGFGIGLYLCKEIIQRHNGKIWLESEPGKGSTFYFSLAVL